MRIRAGDRYRLSELEVAATMRLRDEDKLSWRRIGRIMRRDHRGLSRAYLKRISDRKARP